MVQSLKISAYVSEAGKTKVNMFFKSAENILLTRIKLKVKTPVYASEKRNCICNFPTQ